MKRTRLWRIATAAVATSALMMTAAGGVATAQSPDDLAEFEDQIREILGEDDEDEGGSPLDELLENLDPSQLEDLLGQLSGDDGEDGDNEDADDVDGPSTEDGEAVDGDVPGTDLGGFVGTARGTGLEIGIGLPAELADGLEPLLDGLGIRDADTGGIRIALADTEAELQRAGSGEEVEGLAKALVTNLLLDSEAADQPGACQGADTVELPPDADVPLLRITVADIDCEQDDERAFANAQLAGATVSLAGLIEAGFPEDIRTGFNEVLDPLNENLGGALDQACREGLSQILDPLLPGNEACDALELEIQNPFDVDIPLVDVDLLGSTSEVTANDDEVTADAQATLAGINVLGLVCVGGDGTEPLTYTASAATDGDEATQSSSAPDAQGRLCPNESSILRLITDIEAFQSIDLFEQNITNLVDGELEQLFAGVEELLAALGASVVTNGQAYGDVDGAGAVAGVSPLTIVGAAPFGEIPGLDEFLGDLEVRVEAMSVEAAVNAEPDEPVIPSEDSPTDPAEPSEPARDLPKTGASAAGLLGLAALGAAAALRRRED
jgi:hypothetical protein